MNRDTIYRVSLDVFLSGVKLSQGFYVFIYLCTLPTHHGHVSKGRVCLYILHSTHSTLHIHDAGWWTVSGPCRLQVAFSFNPFVSARRGAVRRSVLVPFFSNAFRDNRSKEIVAPESPPQQHRRESFRKFRLSV